MASIVFCEDDPTIRRLIQVALRSLPHDVHLAADGREGLALIERERPNLVFTDVSMPELDGFQLLAALKAHPQLAEIPVIFVTASAQRVEIEEGRRHGAADYLTKPFSPVDLRAKIEQLLDSEA